MSKNENKKVNSLSDEDLGQIAGGITFLKLAQKTKKRISIMWKAA